MHIPGISNPADTLQHNAVCVKVINPADCFSIFHSFYCNLAFAHQAIAVKIVGIVDISGIHIILTYSVHKSLKSADSPAGL